MDRGGSWRICGWLWLRPSGRMVYFTANPSNIWGFSWMVPLNYHPFIDGIFHYYFGDPPNGGLTGVPPWLMESLTNCTMHLGCEDPSASSEFCSKFWWRISLSSFPGSFFNDLRQLMFPSVGRISMRHHSWLTLKFLLAYSFGSCW